MSTLENYAAFVAIVERGSLTAAARHLGRSLQSVSRALAALEAELGIVLVRRTTRTARPTEAGLAFHARIAAALADIALARDEAAQHGAVTGGRIRVAASTLFAPRYVVPAVAAFMTRHPGVEVEMRLADRAADLIGEDIDVAVRIGALPSSGLTARRLASLRRIAFAAPGYLAAHGRPAHPAELADHRCVVRAMGPESDRWPFLIDGQEVRIRVDGPFRADDAAACNEAVAQGLGLGMAPLWQVLPLVDQGRVEIVLPGFEPPPVDVHAVWPGGRALPARTRLFIDHLVARFAAERL